MLKQNVETKRQIIAVSITLMALKYFKGVKSDITSLFTLFYLTIIMSPCFVFLLCSATRMQIVKSK